MKRSLAVEVNRDAIAGVADNEEGIKEVLKRRV
jgi:hypothetical protein